MPADPTSQTGSPNAFAIGTHAWSRLYSSVVVSRSVRALAGMTAKARTDLLTTTELYNLDQACVPIAKAFGDPVWLVGSAGIGNDGAAYRDVDVRLMLDDGEFEQACPTRERWELL